MRRLIGFGKVVGFIVANLVFAAVFARGSRWFGPPTAAANPADALGAVGSLVGLAVVGWMLLSTLLYMGAVASGVPALVRSVEWMTIGPVRKVVNHSVAGVLAASTLASAAAPAAASSAPEPVVYEMDLATSSWLDSGVETQRRSEGIQAARAEHTAQRFAESSAIASRLGEYLPQHMGPSAVGVVAAVEAADEAATVTVVDGDNTWVMSERHLETVLGRAPTAAELDVYWRAVVSTNADTVRSGDPNLIYPGEELTLPSVAEVLADPDAVGSIRFDLSSPDLGDDPDDDEGGETASSETDESTTTDEAATAAPGAVAQPDGEGADTSTSTPPTDVDGGSVGGGEDPFAGVVTDVDGGSVGGGEDPSAVSWAGDDEPVDPEWAESFGPGMEPPSDNGEIVWMEPTPPPESGDGSATKLAMFGVGGTAALGAAGALLFRRKGHGGGGGGVAPVVDGDELEVDLGAADRTDTRYLWAAGMALVGLSDPAPTPQAVTVGTERCWVVSPRAGDRTPRGFMASRPGLWEVPTSALVDRYEDVAAEALPGLVNVGVTVEGAAVAANVEDGLVVSLDGAKPHVDPIVAAIAERLASNGQTRVVWVGDGPPRGCEQMSVGSALDLFEGMPRPSHTSVVSRRRGIPQPLLVVAAVDLADRARSDLMSAVSSFGPDRGVAALVTWAAPEARPEFAWRVPEHGTVIVGSLPPIKVDGVKAAKVKASTVEDAAPLARVEVQVLGEPRLVVGGEAVTDMHPKAVEAAAWLSSHPRGGTADTLIDALWPDAPRHTNKKPQLHRMLSTLRGTVGEGALPKADRQRTQAGPWYRATLATDLDRFDAYQRAAAEAETETETAAHLANALGLVRGVPYGPDGWTWGVARITAAHQKIHDVAHEAADLATRLGLYDQADAAAEAGLRTDPVCSKCWERQIESAVSSGDPDRARRLADARKDTAFV